MLADGLRQGRLYIPQTPSQGFLQDMVPFEGHYYLQWGPFPAVIHLAVKLAGANLSDRVACLLAGWLSSLVFLEIMLLLWRHYFPTLPKWICLWFFLAFALGTPTAFVSLRGMVYHESIAIAALCVLVGFVAFLRYAETQATRWALCCGMAVSLAITTRVTLAVYAAGLFAGMAALQRRWRLPGRKAVSSLAAFGVPVVVSILLMLAYNQVRFHSPWEYGVRYVPAPKPRPDPYALNRIPENFRHYVLAPIWVGRRLPWLQHIGWPPLVHTERVEEMSSMFLASPFLVFAGLTWSLFRSKEARLEPVKIFAAVAGCSGLAVFLTLLCFTTASRRYMQDFVPEFMILAFLGVAAHSKHGVDWRRWQAAACIVLLLSVLIHVHLSFFQGVHRSPDKPDVIERFDR